ncbi:MAG: ferritin [Candidatus Aminicenantes bacterium]|nr:ferritin [Candidatus Aminicenantes bacterium]
MIPSRIRDLMNEQIKHELESSYIYLSMVAYFHEQNLDGMAHWMRVQAHEETTHAMKFFDHIIDRGGRVELLDLKQLKTTWSSPLEAWKDAYAHEQFITSKIHAIVKAVREEGDYSAEPLMDWFVKEQIEEEKNTDGVVRQIERVGDGKQGLFMMDRELGGRAWPAGSCFDPVSYNTPGT